jgi:hypothetical protein
VRAEIAAIRPSRRKSSQKNLAGGKAVAGTFAAFLGTMVHGIVMSATGAFRFVVVIKKSLSDKAFFHSRNFARGDANCTRAGRIMARRRRPEALASRR